MHTKPNIRSSYILNNNIDGLAAPRHLHEHEPERGIRGSDDIGPCSYCGQPYKQAAAARHFIPCNICDSLEHPGCRH